jgi:hypothetical protein
MNKTIEMPLIVHSDEHTKGSNQESPTEFRASLEEDKIRLPFIFFVNHAYRENKRRKCHFVLAFCSVMIVVLQTLVINTVIEKGPIIFLSLA